MRFSLSLLLALTVFGLTTLPARSVELTPDQLASLKARLESIKETLTNQLKARNISAAQAFLEASNSPATAVELYLKCINLVNYTQQGRPESDFRAWKDNQGDRLKNPAFLQSLQNQLRYLALSCQAAETEDKAQIFNSLISYVDSLSRLTEPPSGELTQSVAGSIFARAYHIENMLGGNQNWEPVPINIAGIYSKTILPYLRQNDPGSLMGAWDRRIEQQARLVNMLEAAKASELRGLNRDESRRVRNQQSNQNGAVKEHSKEEFEKKTLPLLHWGKLKDKFVYADALAGASEMLQFVEANLQTEIGEQLFSEFEALITTQMKKAEGAGAAPATPP